MVRYGPSRATENAPPVVNPANPDNTFLPFINSWKDSLDRDVTVPLNASERDAFTEARCDTTAAMQPIFKK